MAEKKENGLKKRLLSTFKVEAKDLLNVLTSGLVRLEKSPSANVQIEILEAIYRGTHSLKGAARAVNMANIEAICQSLENIFSVWKEEGRVNLSNRVFDALYSSVDIINKIILSTEEGQTAVDENQISRILGELTGIEVIENGAEIQERGKETAVLSQDEAVGRVKSTAQPLAPASDTVRISTGKLGSMLLEVEEMLSAKMISSQNLSSLIDINGMFDLLKTECKKVCIDVPKVKGTGEGKNGRREKVLDIHQGLKVQEFLGWTQTQIKIIEGKMMLLTKSSRQFNKSLDRMVDDLLSDMKDAMLLPFFTILEVFPLLVRNISHEIGKEVELVLKGEWVEIDRRVLEEIKNPLMHIVRNCIDHGIEKPEIRLKNDKKRQGTITIAISYMSGDKVELIVSDDGAGIDIEKVKGTAVKNGLLSQIEADSMNEDEVLSLIFKSGFSTSPIITDVSGRGLGLAIVREMIEKLNGLISVETKINAGAKFRIILPITVATFRGVVVRTAGQTFILPSSNVECVARVKNDEIKTVENRETITLNDKPLSFVWLNSVLRIPPKKEKRDNLLFISILVLNIGESRIAFGVDGILGEEEVMSKRLGRQLQSVRNISGAALLGSGKPVPILNVPDLMRSAVKAEVLPKMPSVEEGIEGLEKKSILVVEDSITSRILLKTILESAGYDVRTAVDGIDAITILKNEDFDLVVSDVEMPRMDGFDLTSKIRSDKKLAELPVVLVTALERREDKERGIDVGADAYIAKSDFVQSNLIEVVRRLI
ncbi:MAG: response regulator [Nitrospinae bacterium]|nr:response regulator [Nitrospinota bacterium]